SYQKLLDKGFVTLAKTNMDEFAMGSTSESSFYGPVKNPHDTSRVPGGSSGGSAAAVAAGMAPASLGSDTGGSIRQPAAFCGVVGIKPTYGRVSRYGLVSYASSLDQIGTFARSVDDAALLLSLISGKDDRDSTSIKMDIDFAPENLSADVKGMRVGIPEEYFNGASEEIKTAVMGAVAELEKAGAKVVKISLKMTEYAIPAYYLIATAEASSNLARFDGVRYGYRSANVTKLSDLYAMTRSEGFGSEVKRRIILGTFALSSGYYDAYYLQALKARTLIIRDFKDAFEKADVIVTPVTTSTAFTVGEKMNDPLEMYLSDILTISANLAAIPGISVPVGKDAKGLPIGLQIMGNHFCEKTILGCAKAVEKVYGRCDAAI
ncbi:MAG: Asp-tRNA(Asn)/Glu-tRNA(Gln) amidotransferase subunit GatA, partial [Spirochaetota bacterium]